MDCRNCSRPLGYMKMFCTFCGEWSPNGKGENPGEAVKDDDFIDAVDVEAITVERIVTGGPWDDCWGGGFVPTSITLLGGAPGAGKLLCLKTPLPTPEGWTTMGDVRRGDTLFDERGECCAVTHVMDIVQSKRSYEVIFSDGESIVADAEHLWLTRTKKERMIDTGGAVRTTQEILDSLRCGVGDTHTNHSIVRAAPLVLPEAQLPVAPYTLGVRLGAGTTRAGERKYIPTLYLRASITQRLELLRGLMDTDGECDACGQCSFSTSLIEMRDGFSELLASLGIKSYWEEREARACWRFSFTTEARVFELSRKRQHQVGPALGVDQRRYIVAIRPVHSVPMRCIAVDSPSHLYLAGRGMVPTHNSTLLLQLSVKVAEITKRPTYYISAEQDKGELMMTLRRLKIPLERGQLRLLKKMGAGGALDEAMMNKTPPGMIILDSVSALCGNDKHMQIAVAKSYKQYAIKYRSPTFLIAHMTKESDFAGLMALQHEVDTLVTLFPEEDGSRHLKAWKHRYGPTHAEYKLLMTENGLIAAPPKPEKKKRGMMLPPVTMPLVVGSSDSSESKEESAGEPGAPGETQNVVISADVPKKPRKFKETPDTIITPEGQKLVRATRTTRQKVAHGAAELLKGLGTRKGPKEGPERPKPSRASAVEGEALKTRRTPMPKLVKGRVAPKAPKATKREVRT